MKITCNVDLEFEIEDSGPFIKTLPTVGEMRDALNFKLSRSGMHNGWNIQFKENPLTKLRKSRIIDS